MNGGMTECSRCDCDPCVCDKQRIELSDIHDKLNDNYTLGYKIFLIQKGILLAFTRIGDSLAKGHLPLEDVEALERFVVAERRIFHPPKWWQFWKRS